MVMCKSLRPVVDLWHRFERWEAPAMDGLAVGYGMVLEPGKRAWWPKRSRFESDALLQIGQNEPGGCMRNTELDRASWRALRPLFLAMVLFWAVIMWAASAWPAGITTESKYYQLTRSGIPQLPAPTTLPACLQTMSDMIKAERKRRYSGYITYRCFDVTQVYVKFTKDPPVVLSKATVSWTPPTMMVAGGPLTDLAGYTVLYGPDLAASPGAISVAPGTTSLVIEGLVPGAYQFAVRANNAAGPGPLSSIVTKTFP